MSTLAEIIAEEKQRDWQRICRKLPEISKRDGWLWPPRLSLEQCSSEETARYKRSLLPARLGEVWDLTGGLGVDSYYLSDHAAQLHYVEHQPLLCELAVHNFGLTDRPVLVHHAEAEEVLATISDADLIYLDPARRDSNGGKVFRLQDCTPDLTLLYPQLIGRCRQLLLKLSPMLDITDALRHLPDAREVHIVALRGEVKEVLVRCRPGEGLRYVAVNLLTDDPVVEADSLQPQAPLPLIDSEPEGTFYLAEPGAAVQKAGLQEVVAERYGLSLLARNSHLYLSAAPIDDFPGRVFLAHVATKEELRQLTQANVISRNHPLRADELKKKYKLRDGGDTFLIGTRARVKGSDRPLLFLAERLR